MFAYHVYYWSSIGQGTLDILEEESHIKDGLSRIMVEMIKREWPQQYPNMLEEFERMCGLGVSHKYRLSKAPTCAYFYFCHVFVSPLDLSSLSGDIKTV